MNAFQRAMHFLAQGAVNIDASYKTVEPDSNVHKAMHAVCAALPFGRNGVRFIIGRAGYRQSGDHWVVSHPSNDSILAYCDSEEDAKAVVQCLRTLGEHFEKP